MNFYRRFPGDYARDTKHLTMLEHGAYNLLLDVLYSTEKPLPNNEALLFRVCSASTKREKRAIKYVLSEFFYEKPTGFSNARFEKELSIAASRINAARNNGSMGGRPHKTKPTDNPAHNPEHNPQESYPDSRLQTPQTTPLPPNLTSTQDQKASSLFEGALAAPSPSRPPAFAGQNFSVTEKQDHLLAEAFPWVDREAEYLKADSWLEANPSRKPKRISPFLHNWFNRIEKGNSNGARTKADERAERTGDAIRRVFGSAGKVAGDIRRALPAGHH